MYEWEERQAVWKRTVFTAECDLHLKEWLGFKDIVDKTERDLIKRRNGECTCSTDDIRQG